MRDVEVGEADMPLCRAPPTKSHGAQPPHGSGQHETRVMKGSFLHAQRRASQAGYAWYRGQYIQYMTATQLGATQPSLPQGQSTRCLRQASRGQRLQVFSWNAEGPRAFDLQQFAHWAHSSAYHLCILPEMHWQFDNKWSLPVRFVFMNLLRVSR